MGVLEWLRVRAPKAEDEVPSGLSRRDFFAKVVGRGPVENHPPAPTPPDVDVLHTFFITGFPYYDGPVLVPMLQPGIQLQLRRDYDHPTDPTAVRIYWGRDHLGFVPSELSPEVHRLIGEGPPPRCRVRRVNPAADLAEVVQVDLIR